MSPKLVTVTFNTQRIGRMTEFYSALGANLQSSAVSKGGDVFRGILGNLELVLHSIVIPGESPTPRVSLRFELHGINEIWNRIKAVPDVNIMLDLSEMPTGRSFIAIDPDGHSIEIFEKWPETGEG